MAYFISYSVPSIREPIGHPKPLDKHTETVSKSSVMILGEIFKKTAALRHRAPSKCIFILYLFAKLLIFFM
jgi:hypothetical protein